MIKIEVAEGYWLVDKASRLLTFQFAYSAEAERDNNGIQEYYFRLERLFRQGKLDGFAWLRDRKFIEEDGTIVRHRQWIEVKNARFVPS